LADVRHERVLRGIPRWLLRGYLEDLGGRATAPIEDGRAHDDPAAVGPAGSPSLAEDQDVLVADGWRARLTQLEDYRIGSLRSGQVELVITGEASDVEAVLKRLEPRLFRGGG
jgi:hypothetical protein